LALTAHPGEEEARGRRGRERNRGGENRAQKGGEKRSGVVPGPDDTYQVETHDEIPSWI